jgi:hypothetical protein
MTQSIPSRSIQRDITTTQAEEGGATSSGFHTIFYLRSVFSIIVLW